jgi:hypothetical protein
MRHLLFLLPFLLGMPAVTGAQPTTSQTAALLPDRPLPHPVVVPPSFERAIAQGTRTANGAPGPNYWTNTADYALDAHLEPDSAMLYGSGSIRYQNNSPDSLAQLVLHLRQNLHTEDAVRNRYVPLTAGMQVANVVVAGDTLQEHPLLDLRTGTEGYVILGTRMLIVPAAPVLPGSSIELSMDWQFEVPEAGAPRMGQDGEVFYLGYWYPQLAVYDDVNGWTAELYQGDGEFYMGYGAYDVSITVPEGWLVGATGTLQNPESVLSAPVRQRLAVATQPDTIVSIVGADERSAGSSTAASDDGTLTWRFRAENVRDFAFGTSAAYVWDAAMAQTGDADDGTAMIHAFYRPDVTPWQRSAEYARFAVEHLSEMLMPYPYPHMTAVEGIIGGGMEYPMMTLIGSNYRPRGLFSVTYHEISHMWFPMIVGQNEKHYTWMDEGTTSFNTAEGASDFYNDDAWESSNQSYFRLAGTDDEMPSMRHADNYPFGTPARGIASYSKPALILHALRGIIGEERFFEAYRTYAERWAYKHPQPYDLFNTFEDVLSQDLDWFWTPTLYETWTLDHAVARVDSSVDSPRVTIADEGLVPMPVPLRVTYADGTTINRMVPVDVWLKGTRETTVNLEPGSVTGVVIDPKWYLPDVDRSDNRWSSGSRSASDGG